MIFSKDILDSMKECLLNVIWPKDELLAFFTSHGCKQSDISQFRALKDINRSRIIDLMFECISQKDEGGYTVFRAIQKGLLTWDRFDSYYFIELEKLNKDDALAAIASLQKLVDIQTEKDEANRQRRQSAKLSDYLAEEFQTHMLSFFRGNSTPDIMEPILKEILEEIVTLSYADITSPFSSKHEQLDATLRIDEERFFVGAKWSGKAEADKALKQFSLKVEKTPRCKGIFISLNGFSKKGLAALKEENLHKTILFDGKDIMAVIENKLSFAAILEKKIDAIEKEGCLYFDVIKGKSKIK